MTRQEIDALARDLVRAERDLVRLDRAADSAMTDPEQQRWGFLSVWRRFDEMLMTAWEIDALEQRFEHAVSWWREARPASRRAIEELAAEVRALRTLAWAE
jgi:hypothetical protein